mgnify:CR=1 FL=1
MIEYNFDQIVWIFTDQISNFLGLSQADSICITKPDITTTGNYFNIELNTVVDFFSTELIILNNNIQNQSALIKVSNAKWEKEVNNLDSFHTDKAKIRS